MMTSPSLPSVLLFALVLALKTSNNCVSGWGKIGHEMIGNVAWQRLSNSTKDAVRSILLRKDGTYGDHDDAGSPLASVADWADMVRYTKFYHWTGPLHYIDVRDDLIPGGCHVVAPGEDSDCHFDYERDCPSDFCVAGAIVNYTSHLLDNGSHNTPTVVDRRNGYKGSHTPTTNHLRRSRVSDEPTVKDNPYRDSLEFVTHFVGDIHQPLHSSRTSDRGGNSIKVVFNAIMTPWSRIYRQSSQHKAWNLHSVWDDAMIDRALARDYDHQQSLFVVDLVELGQEKEDLWLECSNGLSKECTSLWGEESLQAALSWGYRNIDGSEIVAGDSLSEEYYETRLPVVKDRVAAAGVRLAATLELVFAGYESNKETTASMGVAAE